MSNKRHQIPFFIIRHGQTDWNLERRLQGHTDIPINTTGIAQAKQAAHFLHQLSINPTRIYASDLQRAYKTAEIIGNTHNLTVTPSPLLREAHHGEAEGLTIEERNERFKHLIEKHIANYPDPHERGNHAAIPGAEPHNEVITRVKNHMSWCASSHPEETTILVSHAGVIDALIIQSGGNENVPLPNCCIAHFTYDSNQQTLEFHTVHVAK